MPEGYVGWGIANTLEQLMAQKKAEARQKMLDELNAEDTRSQIAYRASQAKTAEESAKALAEQREEAAWVNRVKPLSMGQDVTDMDPDLLKEGASRGYFTQTPRGQLTPSVTTSESEVSLPGGDSPDLKGLIANAPPPEAKPNSPSGHYYYAGSPAERSTEDRRNAFGAILSSPEFYKRSPLEQAIMTRQADPEDQTSLTGLFTEEAKRQNPPVEAVLTPNNKFSIDGKETDTLPPGAHVTRGFQPRPAPQGNFSYAGPDPKTSQPVILDTHTGITKINPGSTPIGPKPIYNPAADDKIDAPTLSAYRSSIGVRQVKVAQQAIIERYRTSNEVKKIVTAILNLPQARSLPVEELINQGALSGSPKAIEDTTRLLEVIRARPDF